MPGQMGSPSFSEARRSGRSLPAPRTRRRRRRRPCARPAAALGGSRPLPTRDPLLPVPSAAVRPLQTRPHLVHSVLRAVRAGHRACPEAQVRQLLQEALGCLLLGPPVQPQGLPTGGLQEGQEGQEHACKPLAAAVHRGGSASGPARGRWLKHRLRTASGCRLRGSAAGERRGRSVVASIAADHTGFRVTRPPAAAARAEPQRRPAAAGGLVQGPRHML